MNSKIIAVDFDGTLCENKWPEIGEPNNEVINYLKQEKAAGTKFILWTCRTGDKLTNAIRWCSDRGLTFDAINRNVKEAIEEFGEDTRKVFANEYIDDKSSHQFGLPFTKRETGITDEVIRSLELLFGFSMYDWQKRYLKGDDTATPNGGRGNGKTFAHCVRLLLEDPWTRPSFDLSNWMTVKNLVDENRETPYNHFFHSYLRELNQKLVAAGFRTNAKKQVSWSLIDEDLKSITIMKASKMKRWTKEKELTGSLDHGEPIVISGNCCTGKTTLVSVLTSLGYDAVEADNVCEIEFTTSFETRIRNLDDHFRIFIQAQKPVKVGAVESCILQRRKISHVEN